MIKAQEAAAVVQEAPKPKPVEGPIMADGLIHTKTGQLFFQDYTPVGGVNLHDWKQFR